MIPSTIDGKKYVLVHHIGTRSSCAGCALEHGLNKEHCGTVVSRASAHCVGSLIFIEDNPEAIADYMARRLDT